MQRWKKKALPTETHRSAVALIEHPTPAAQSGPAKGFAQNHEQAHSVGTAIPEEVSWKTQQQTRLKNLLPT